MILQYMGCSFIFLVLSGTLLFKILKEKKLIEIIMYFNLLCLILSLCFIMYGNYENKIIYINIGLIIIGVKTIILLFLFKYMKLGDA